MNIFVIVIFAIGYLAIIFEEFLKINKTASALLTAVLCWLLIILGSSQQDEVINELSKHLSSISEIVFFLLGAMTIVEIVDSHDGFQFITDKIRTDKKNNLIWLISLITFFLSAVLDNLTTTIVMATIISKLVVDKKAKWLLLGLVVISANAGGAWSPIGDVTTTMLWIGDQISPANIIKQTIFPSLICMVIPTIIVGFMIKGKIHLNSVSDIKVNSHSSQKERNLIFFVGVGALLFVPVFKTITHLPPYMGMMLSLGFLWMFTEIIHFRKPESEKKIYSVSSALQKIDTPSVLFFFGILMTIASLEYIHVLPAMAKQLNQAVGSLENVAIGIGFLSAIFDNVPLVAVLQGMYSLETYPTDHYFWELLAYCAGTGGSCLIIGSAAGVAVMGMEKIDFIWYLKNISWIAVIGFLSGALFFILQHSIFS
jgi:Na+/H+ antiporter NhaD/arsenite permease-like protein